MKIITTWVVCFYIFIASIKTKLVWGTLVISSASRRFINKPTKKQNKYNHSKRNHSYSFKQQIEIKQQQYLFLFLARANPIPFKR
jgi:hypothetical protein